MTSKSITERTSASRAPTPRFLTARHTVTSIVDLCIYKKKSGILMRFRLTLDRIHYLLFPRDRVVLQYNQTKFDAYVYLFKLSTIEHNVDQ